MSRPDATPRDARPARSAGDARRSARIGLLVSARNADEAQTALAAGVDLIDVKEPRRGALGAADAATVRDVVERAGGRVPVSAALGELLDWQPVNRLAACPGLKFAKLGLAGCASLADWPSRWSRALDELPANVGRVAVVYADWQAACAPPPDEVLDAACQFGCRAMLVDTYDKRGGSLLDLWPLATIGRMVRRAREAGLLSVLAGSLTEAHFGALAPLAPDLVAVRGAACAGPRTGELSLERLKRLRAALADCVNAAGRLG